MHEKSLAYRFAREIMLTPMFRRCDRNTRPRRFRRARSHFLCNPHAISQITQQEPAGYHEDIARYGGQLDMVIRSLNIVRHSQLAEPRASGGLKDYERPLSG